MDWQICCGLALHWMIDNVLVDWSRISIWMLDWRWIGKGWEFGWQINAGLVYHWQWIGRLVWNWMDDWYRINGSDRNCQSIEDWRRVSALGIRCLNRALSRHFGRSPTVLVPSALYAMSVWSGGRLEWALPIECQSLSVWIVPLLACRCRLGAEVND